LTTRSASTQRGPRMDWRWQHSRCDCYLPQRASRPQPGCPRRGRSALLQRRSGSRSARRISDKPSTDLFLRQTPARRRGAFSSAVDRSLRAEGPVSPYPGWWTQARATTSTRPAAAPIGRPTLARFRRQERGKGVRRFVLNRQRRQEKLRTRRGVAAAIPGARRLIALPCTARWCLTPPTRIGITVGILAALALSGRKSVS